MRRLLRWAFNFAAAVSAVLFVATVFLWTESYSVTDDLGWQTPVRETGFDRWGIQTIDGFAAARHTVAVFGPYIEHNGVREPTPHGFVWESIGLPGGDHSMLMRLICEHSALGVGCGASVSRSDRERHIVFPLWLPAVLTGVLPIKWASSWRRRRKRVAAGLCVSCGYDLRATPDRCPECGVVPKHLPVST